MHEIVSPLPRTGSLVINIAEAMSTIRMQFSVQRGPCWAANSSSLYDLFAKEGAVEGEVEYDEGKGRGSFVFCDEEVLPIMCLLSSNYWLFCLIEILVI